MTILIIALIAAAIALLFAAVRARDVLAEDEGNEAMRRIGKAIQLGAATFLRREYTFIAVFVAVVFVVLLLFIDIDLLDKFGGSNQRWTSISYLVGAILSASAGYLGMLIAVRANVRTAAKAGPPVAGRICAVRKTDEAIAAAHAKIRKTAQRKQSQVRPQEVGSIGV